MSRQWFWVVGLVFNGLLPVFSAHAVVPQFSSVDLVGQLTDGGIRTITQDQNGFIWAGTNRGLFRFDGYELRLGIGVDQSEDPTTDWRINDLWVDPFNRLWVASNQNGLLIHDLTNNTIFAHNLDPSIIKINQILPSVEGVWLGTNQGLRLLSIHHHKPPSQILEVLPDKNITATLESEDHVLIGTQTGLYTYSVNEQSIVSINKKLASVTVHDLIRDDWATVWIATNKGLYFKPNTDQPLQLIAQTQNKLITHLQLIDNQLWAATISAGLYVVDTKTNKTSQYLSDQSHPQSLSSDNIYSMYLDRQRNLWVGHFNAGLDILPVSGLQYGLETTVNGSYDCAATADVYTIREIDGVVYIGGVTALTVFDPKLGLCQEFSDFGDQSDRSTVNIAAETEDGELILVKGPELYRFDINEKSVTKIELDIEENFFFFVTYDRNHGGYFLGGTGGLYFVDNAFKQADVVPFDKSQPFFNSAIDDRGRHIFVSQEHVSILNKNGYLKPIFYEPSGLNSMALKGNEVWVGTWNKGLVRLNLNGQHEYVMADHAILNDSRIMSVAIHDDVVWMSSYQGLISFDISTHQSVHHSGKLALQALQFNLNSFHLTQQGMLYFGGRNGYNRLNLNEFKFKGDRPPVVTLTELKRFNRPVWPGQADCELCIDRPIEQLQQLALDHRDNIIGFEWSAMAYANPDSVRYAYRLLGLETAWNEVNSSDRNITYTSLRPGDYDFQLMASHDGIKWPDEPLSLAITVSPAPWLSPWAFAIYALALVLMTVFIIHRRTRAANLRAVELEHKVEERTLELVDKNAMIEDLLRQKNALFANITH